MSAIGYGKVLTALFVVGSVAVACGGVDQGRIEIVDGENAGDGSGGTGNPSAGKGGSSSPAEGGDAQGGNESGGEGGTAGSAGRAGAGGEGGQPLRPDPPVVISITPEGDEDQVEPTGSIRIVFSESLDPDSVSGDTIQVLAGDTPVSGELDYTGVTVEFTPDQRLDLLGEYKVLVTTDVTDTDGTPLAEEFSSSFVVRDGQWQEALVVESATAGVLNRRLVSPVIDANGNALVVWGQNKSGQTVGSVFGRYFVPGAGFGTPFEIDTTDVGCDDISVGMNAAGEAIVAWSEIRGSVEQVWSRRINQGDLGPAPQRVDMAGATNVNGTLSAVGPTGEAHVFWWFNDSSGGTDQNLLTNHAVTGAAWLSTPDIIYNYADALSAPAVAFDNDGNGFVFLAFDSDTSAQPPSMLYARRYLRTSGQWGNGVPIDGSENIRVYDPPSVVTDSKGGARAVFAADQDVKVVSFAKASGFSSATTIDVIDAAPSSVPLLASNGSRFLAAWYQSVSLNTNAYSSLSDGATFAAPELRSSGDFQVGYYGNAVPGVDYRGNGLVLFEQGNAANTVDIVFGRLSASSGDWVDGALVNSLEGNYQDPRLTVASNGVAIAAWSLGIRQSANSIFVSTFE